MEDTVKLGLLPHNILLTIFRYLSTEDLQKMKFVCNLWKEVSKEAVLWRNFIFCINKDDSLDHVHKILTTTPVFEQILTRLRNPIPYQLLGVMLENVKNITRMNCSFIPPIRYPDLKTMVNKYKGLKSITLDCSMADVINSLNLLKQKVNNLEGILFYKDVHYDRPGMTDILKNLYIQVYENIRQFPCLKELDVAALNITRDTDLDDAFSQMLSVKCFQLEKLTAEIYPEESNLQALKTCTNLRELLLTVLFHKDYYKNVLDIQNLQHLRYLKITFDYKQENCYYFQEFIVGSLRQIMQPKSLANLQELKVVINCNIHTLILVHIVHGLPQLRSLNLSFNKYRPINTDISNIGKLKNLEEFSLFIRKNRFESSSLTYFCKCKSLKYLKLKYSVKLKGYFFDNDDSLGVNNAIKMITGLKSLKKFIIHDYEFFRIRNELLQKLKQFCAEKSVELDYRLKRDLA